MRVSRRRFNTICGSRMPCRANTSPAWPLLNVAGRDCIFSMAPDSNRLTQGCAYHLFRTSCPAFVLARIGNRNCQIVLALIATLLSTRGTLRPVISGLLAPRSHMIEDSELAPRWIVWRQLDLRFWAEFFRHFEARDETTYL